MRSSEAAGEQRPTSATETAAGRGALRGARRENPRAAGVAARWADGHGDSRAYAAARIARHPHDRRDAATAVANDRSARRATDRRPAHFRDDEQLTDWMWGAATTLMIIRRERRPGVHRLRAAQAHASNSTLNSPDDEIELGRQLPDGRPARDGRDHIAGRLRCARHGAGDCGTRPWGRHPCRDIAPANTPHDCRSCRGCRSCDFRRGP